MTSAPMPSRPDRFVAAARFVGDSGNPFYAEERQRDVWNEASAFGLQLLLWSVLLSATVTVWVVGPAAVPYTAGALGLLGVVSGLTVGYAHRLGVDVAEPHRMLRWRMLPYLALVLALAAGFVRAGAGDFSSSFGIGLVVGAALAVACFAVVVRRALHPGR